MYTPSCDLKTYHRSWGRPFISYTHRANNLYWLVRNARISLRLVCLSESCQRVNIEQMQSGFKYIREFVIVGQHVYSRVLGHNRPGHVPPDTYPKDTPGHLPPGHLPPRHIPPGQITPGQIPP